MAVNGVIKFGAMHFQRDKLSIADDTPPRPRDTPGAYRLNQQFFHEVNPLLSGQILTFLSNCN